MIEEWKTIEYYSDYQISNLGVIKSLKKWRGTNERILKPSKDKDGYNLIILYNGKAKTFKIHRLLLELFKPIVNSKSFECNHINGIKDDNRLENLEWCTKSENMTHAYKIGLCLKGENHSWYGKHISKDIKDKMSRMNSGENSPAHKLTKIEVIEIRKIVKENKMTRKEIAKMFNVHLSTIDRVKSGKTWKHVSIKEGDSNS